MNSLVGLYPVNEESLVLYNKIPINDIDMEFLRKNKIAYVMQNPRMTNKTVSGLFEEIDNAITLDAIKHEFAYLSDDNKNTILLFLKEFWNKQYQIRK